MLGNGFVQTSSPGVSRTDVPSSSNTSTAIPSPRICSSPRYTGPAGSPKAKQLTMSVPPLMLANRTSDLIWAYTKS